MENLGFLGDFFQPPYTEPERPSLDFLSRTGGSGYEVLPVTHKDLTMIALSASNLGQHTHVNC